MSDTSSFMYPRLAQPGQDSGCNRVSVLLFSDIEIATARVTAIHGILLRINRHGRMVVGQCIFSCFTLVIPLGLAPFL